ncbi:nyctalopin-like [Spea bombifrons]|uniref:nyctalopin-like n=1 Tax=Spea bombifrons TaxID=233779 RepID=UPI00234BA214|nr:nyctalopin-like [Spea bombifrons]
MIGDAFSNTTCPSLCHCSSDDDVYCDKMGFRSLPLNLPVSAVSLYLEGNLFRVLTFNAFKNVPILQNLWINQNNLTFLYPGAFISLNNLKELNLSENSRLTYLHAHTFRGLFSLIFLDLSSCNLFEIHPLVFSHVVSLEVLNLGSNKFHYIPQALRKLHNLTTLSLENNHIEAIGKNSFKNQQALRDLNLRRNRIWVIENDAFNELNKLNVLNLGHNSLSYLPNQLFSDLIQVRIMYLEANWITRINCSFNSLVNLKKLHLNNNRIMHIAHNAFSSLKELQFLHLNKNNLTSIPGDLFANMPKLKHVFLSFNPWSCDCRMAWIANWMLTYNGAVRGLHCVYALSYKTGSGVFTQKGTLCSHEKAVDDRCVEISMSSAPKRTNSLCVISIILILVWF